MAMNDMFAYFISALLGGFALGFIFLGYFDNITRTHMYITIVAAAAFILNFLATSWLIHHDLDRIVKAFPGSMVYVVMFASFVAAGYTGRRVSIKMRRKKHVDADKLHTELQDMVNERKEGGDLTDEESNLRDSNR